MSEQEMTNEERHQQYRAQAGYAPVAPKNMTFWKTVLAVVTAQIVLAVAGGILFMLLVIIGMAT